MRFTWRRLECGVELVELLLEVGDLLTAPNLRVRFAEPIFKELCNLKKVGKGCGYGRTGRGLHSLKFMKLKNYRSHILPPLTAR